MSALQRLAASLLWWFTGPAIALLIWLILRYATPGLGEAEQGYRLWFQTEFFPDGWNIAAWTPLAWFGIAVWLLGQAVIFMDDGPAGMSVGGVALCGAAAAVVFCGPFWTGVWDNDKDTGRYYLSATTFVVPDPAPPSANALLTGAGGKTANCDAIGAPGDIRSCIDRVTAPYAPAWQTRAASLAGSLRNLNNSASTLPRVDVWEETATYLYGEGWSVILDGSGWQQPTYGVAIWDGSTNATRVCRFKPGTFKRAFHGERMNDLHNWLAEHYRDLIFDDSDVWGYCEGTPDSKGHVPPVEQRTPVIVVPVQRAVPHEVQTVRAPAGVLVLRGSPTGAPDVTYRPTVHSGEFPGPVYPLSIAEKQRCATEWAAGRGARDRLGFGFTPAGDDADDKPLCDDDGVPAGQIGNTSEFVLRDAQGRLSYVTPVAPRTSKSQAVVGYVTVPADQVTAGHLNAMTVRLLPDGTSYANVNTAVADAQDYVSTAKPGFISSGGKLTEYVPIDGDRWRIYGEMRGQTRLYLDVSATRRTQPVLVDLLAGGQAATTPAEPAQAGECGAPPGKLDDATLIRCAGEFVGELGRRNSKETAGA